MQHDNCGQPNTLPNVHVVGGIKDFIILPSAITDGGSFRREILKAKRLNVTQCAKAAINHHQIYLGHV